MSGILLAVAITLQDATVRSRPDGPPVLDRVSLDLPPGRRVALVGANGAGKFTLAAADRGLDVLTVAFGPDYGPGDPGDDGQQCRGQGDGR